MKVRHLASLVAVFAGCAAVVACTSTRSAHVESTHAARDFAVEARTVSVEPVSDLTSERILRDTEGRISPVFKVPESLKESARFWLKVYTQFDSEDFVIYDAQHPSAIYEVLDFHELRRRSRNRAAYEIVRRRRIQRVLDAYRRGFGHLSRNAHPKHLTREEQIILATARCIPGLPARGRFYFLRAAMRTQTGQRDDIMRGLAQGSQFFPAMEEIFRQMGIPVELTRIPLVESSFQTKAYSKAQAVGVWQFLRSSAKDLVIDDVNRIDERLSPLKGTVAAGRLLKANYRSLRSWPLAITAYNHGFKNLSRLKPRMNPQVYLSRVFDSARGHRKLGYASRNYYAEFLAVVHAVAYREFFYGAPSALAPAQFVRFEKVRKPTFASRLAARNSMSLQEFRMWNPDFRDLRRAIPAGSVIAVPSDSQDLSSLKLRGKLASSR